MENSAPISLSGCFVELWKQKSAAKPGLRIYENKYSICPCWIQSDYNQLALHARWLFYHFISNSGSWNNCYITHRSGLLLNSVISNSYYGMLRRQIHRGYYTVARRYEFYVRVARTVSPEWAQRTSGILFLPREHKIHIFELTRNVLFNI